MKRSEFKLLLEDWKKNFIAESPKDPYGVQQPLDQDDLDFAGDYDGMDSDSIETMDDMSMLDDDDKDLALGIDHLDSDDDSLKHYDHSLPSSDSEEGVDGFSGMYASDPTYSSGDYSSMGQDDENTIDISDIENVNLLDLDEF